MTEIKNMPTDSGNEPITVETAKVIRGMSLVFCGGADHAGCSASDSSETNSKRPGRSC